MSYDPGLIDLIAHQVLSCVCAELDSVADADETETQPGCPCRACVVPGQLPSIVVCDAGCGNERQQGQLYVNITRVFMTTNFPVQDQSAIKCKPATMAVELLITLMRCTATLDQKGNPPTCDQLSAVAAIVNTDMRTVMNAVMCCVPFDPLRPSKTRRVAVIDQRSKGPDGTVVGFETRIIVDLNDSCGCPEEPS
jgi:hypothetical protein